MATSSFDRDVIITEDNVQSLIDIVNNKNYEKVDFSNTRKIETMSNEKIEKYFKIKGEK